MLLVYRSAFIKTLIILRYDTLLFIPYHVYGNSGWRIGSGKGPSQGIRK